MKAVTNRLAIPLIEPGTGPAITAHDMTAIQRRRRAVSIEVLTGMMRVEVPIERQMRVEIGKGGGTLMPVNIMRRWWLLTLCVRGGRQRRHGREIAEILRLSVEGAILIPCIRFVIEIGWV